MKPYIEPKMETIELEIESSILTDSDKYPATDHAGFGEPSNDID